MFKYLLLNKCYNMPRVFILFFLALFFVACNKQSHNERDILTKIDTVATDTLNQPLVIKIIRDSLTIISCEKNKLSPRVIKAGKPKITHAILPVFVNDLQRIKAGDPQLIEVKNPLIADPSKDTTIKIPKPFIPGALRIVTASAPRYKEQAIAGMKYLDIEQGLSSSYICDVLEDKSGNIWIGTMGGGVCRYDGETFSYYTVKEGLADNVVNSICEDYKGNLWFGTNNGVTFYNGITFTNYSQKEGLKSNSVKVVFEDKKHNIWLGTSGGLHCYDGKTFKIFTANQGLSNNSILCIHQDKKENLWFGTYGGGAICYNGKSFYNYTQKDGLCNNLVWDISEDRKGNLWFGTDGFVDCFDGKYFSHFSNKEGLKSSWVWAVEPDSHGNIWMGTWNWLSMYNGRSVETFTEQHGMTSNAAVTICEDKSGIIWIGTYGGGLIRYDGAMFTHLTDSVNNFVVEALTKDSFGNLWFGHSGGGVSVLDGETFKNYGKKEGLGETELIEIFQDKSGKLWFGMDWGLWGYDGANFIYYPFSAGQKMMTQNIFQDRSGTIWFASLGAGLLSLKNDTLIKYPLKCGIPDNRILDICEDKHGNLLFASHSSGIISFDQHKFIQYTTKNGLCDNATRVLCKDASGNIWIGTNKNGISLFDGKNFFTFSEKEGLSNNSIKNILTRNDTVWIGTISGITRLAPIKKALKNNPLKWRNYTVKTYGLNEGFRGNDCTTAACFDNNGNIWYGTGKDITVYNPSCDKEDTIPPSVNLKSIRLFFEDIDWANIEKKHIEIDSMERFYPVPINLILPYNQNHLTFNFIGINWKNPEKIKYQFILDGYDDKWNPVTSKTEATYTNLSSGKYTFKVKAINADGYWSYPKSFIFEITPPWWQTWWFRTLLIISGILLIFSFIKWRERKLKKDKLLLEKKVREQTHELSEKNEELNQQNEEITAQRDEIEAQRDLVVEQKNKIEEIHHEITQSIDYATRLQSAILPDPETLNNIISEQFVIFKPKDKVSGDFYWWAVVENHLIITVADCTGHGVPGAFMSMLGSSLLREIVIKEYVTNPAIILKRLRKEIVHILKQKGISGEQKDGMDMALVTINIETFEMQFAGANNSCYIVSKSKDESENISMLSNFQTFDFKLNELKGDKMPIAIYERMDSFTNKDINLKRGDMIYLFSDGYADQFGGPKGKKFKYSQFEKLILENSVKSMQEQGSILAQTIDDWKNSFSCLYEQTDDITIMGIKM